MIARNRALVCTVAEILVHSRSLSKLVFDAPYLSAFFEFGRCNTRCRPTSGWADYLHAVLAIVGAEMVRDTE